MSSFKVYVPTEVEGFLLSVYVTHQMGTVVVIKLFESFFVVID
jgi:hypothetical protein